MQEVRQHFGGFFVPLFSLMLVDLIPPPLFHPLFSSFFLASSILIISIYQDYEHGQRCGMGKMYFANGDLYYGEWYQDQYHGQGRFYYACGRAFEGTFYRGKRTGKGKLQHPSGKVDIFPFWQDSPCGPGVRWSADRRKTWLLTPQGKCKKQIPIAEAISIGCDCDYYTELGRTDICVGTLIDSGTNDRSGSRHSRIVESVPRIPIATIARLPIESVDDGDNIINNNNNNTAYSSNGHTPTAVAFPVNC